MTVWENHSLSQLTTFKVGGLARYVVVCESKEDVSEAITHAATHALPLTVLGGGSNVLARDDNYEGVVLLMRIPGITYKEEGEVVTVTVGAGVEWEMLVTECVKKGYWGIENLAGIPGTVGAAPVQNIGAYGAELQSIFHSAEVMNAQTGEMATYDAAACEFGYRDSVFKRNRALVICSVTLRLSKIATPRLGYGDLAELVRSGAAMDTPEHIATNVRLVRAKKFPDLALHGTAGSFFKNPIITQELFSTLTQKYGAMPSFPAANNGIKIPLAFILDKVLGLRGYRDAYVYLFGNQPLVLVVDEGATARDIDAFANAIAKKVFDATSISIEREVQTL